MIAIGCIWQNTVGKDELIKELIDLHLIEKNRENPEIMRLTYRVWICNWLPFPTSKVQNLEGLWISRVN